MVVAVVTIQKAQVIQEDLVAVAGVLEYNQGRRVLAEFNLLKHRLALLLYLPMVIQEDL